LLTDTHVHGRRSERSTGEERPVVLVADDVTHDRALEVRRAR
jgi:hypothetical protein